MRACIARFADDPKARERASAVYSDFMQANNEQQREAAGAAAAASKDLLSTLAGAEMRVLAKGLNSPSERQRRISAAILAADALAAPLPPMGADALRLVVTHLVLLGVPGSCLPASMLMAEAALLLQQQGAGLAPEGPVQLQHEYHWNRPPNLLNVGG
ncbi:hypothetical protein MNEG_8885 [Monoraphidium neglectum]|jgi:hypothetical protein|uniref:Uncharacterized protein n=1 Tax=Monoraphidium neglectum TaxID=145388 RepID=A0A0D2KUI8_9CHLO|nr:hypothetical protein MNEG_8885 [Monoraphidium neglectum]KIY99073.1 hypothetical protein MNEG_8885 [Monoraphidium neglectum]|eukprot:XP_013898093.1 hypothetical protein MNEG_8885 [Monoraphidium neglectum]